MEKGWVRKKLENIYHYSSRYLPYKSFSKLGINISKFNLTSFLKNLGVGLAAGLVSLPLFIFLNEYVSDQSALFLLFIPIAGVVVYFGNLVSSAGYLLLMFLGTGYILTQLNLNFGNGFFLLSGVAISVIIARAKKLDLLQKYIQREKQYAKSFVDLQDKLDKAQDEIRARDEFLSFASHELKSPLTAMLLQLHSMLHSIRNVSLANFSVNQLMKVLENAEHQIKRLTKMINDLLNVSLITTGKFDLEREKMDLVKSVKDIVKAHTAELKRNKYKLNLQSDGPIVGFWDKVRMEQVITNLLSNAIKYGNQKPIKLSLTNHGKSARLVIQDQGIGMTPEQQKIIFHPFSRGLGKNYKKGLGVGLYIVNQIIEAHAGTIKVDSKPDNGSRFTIELPLNKKK